MTLLFLTNSECAGSVTNIFGNDIMRRFQDFLIASNLPMAIAAFIGGATTVYLLLGWISALAGIGTMLIIVSMNIYVSTLIGKQEKLNLESADKRLNILSEIISSIKAVKFFAWYVAFCRQRLSADLFVC
jgi:hypothetical protein